MYIDLHTISGGSGDLEFSLPAEEIDLEMPGVDLATPVELKAVVEKAADRTRIKGKIATRIAVDCIRCLSPVETGLEFDFDADFVDVEHFSTDEEHEVAGDDLNVDVMSEDSIDLNELAREQILLNLPERIFCRPDCKGLCPKCGADRNLIDCKCEETGTDPRWAALESLK